MHFATEIRNFAQENFHQSDVIASIPHRDVLLLFPAGKQDRLQIQSFIASHEGEARKPLTNRLFLLSETGPKLLTPK